MTLTEPDRAAAPTVARPTEHHLLGGDEGGSRVALCGRIPPWDDQLHCRGRWDGRRCCAQCGGPFCPTCLRLAEEELR